MEDGENDVRVDVDRLWPFSPGLLLKRIRAWREREDLILLFIVTLLTVKNLLPFPIERTTEEAASSPLLCRRFTTSGLLSSSNDQWIHSKQLVEFTKEAVTLAGTSGDEREKEIANQSSIKARQ